MSPWRAMVCLFFAFKCPENTSKCVSIENKPNHDSRTPAGDETPRHMSLAISWIRWVDFCVLANREIRVKKSRAPKNIFQKSDEKNIFVLASTILELASLRFSCESVGKNRLLTRFCWILDPDLNLLRRSSYGKKVPLPQIFGGFQKFWQMDC